MQMNNAAYQCDEIVERLRLAIEVLGVSQQDLAQYSGVHQSQISRILSGRSKRVSRNMLKLNDYVENLHKRITVTSDIPAVLIDAIRVTWNGSLQQAEALAKVIVSMRNLSA